jgi:hypothetical protein
MVAMPLVLEAAEAHAELAFHSWPATSLVAALLALLAPRPQTA